MADVGAVCTSPDFLRWLLNLSGAGAAEGPEVVYDGRIVAVPLVYLSPLPDMSVGWREVVRETVLEKASLAGRAPPHKFNP